MTDPPQTTEMTPTSSEGNAQALNAEQQARLSELKLELTAKQVEMGELAINLARIAADWLYHVGQCCQIVTRSQIPWPLPPVDTLSVEQLSYLPELLENENQRSATMNAMAAIKGQMYSLFGATAEVSREIMKVLQKYRKHPDYKIASESLDQANAIRSRWRQSARKAFLDHL